jgi:hypothetical protein
VVVIRVWWGASQTASGTRKQRMADPRIEEARSGIGLYRMCLANLRWSTSLHRHKVKSQRGRRPGPHLLATSAFKARSRGLPCRLLIASLLAQRCCSGGNNVLPRSIGEQAKATLERCKWKKVAAICPSPHQPSTFGRESSAVETKWASHHPTKIGEFSQRSIEAAS